MTSARVSQHADTLLGGRRSRLIIVRAQPRPPWVQMFDEVTSALDNKIRTIIDRGGVGQLACTQVAIAYILDTTRRPCQFFLIKTGAVVEDGTRGELMARTRGSAELIFRRVA